MFLESIHRKSLDVTIEANMPRIASRTGLIAARTQSVRRPKLKKLELLGSSVPAPFILRPFAGLFNPYPYGCSVLCNHPNDIEVKKVVRRAKDAWASESRIPLSPPQNRIGKFKEVEVLDTTAVPEELFRHFTEMDSRSSSSELPISSTQEVHPHQDKRTRPSLILDLRASSQDIQECETLSKHALRLESVSISRRSNLTGFSRSSRRKSCQTTSSHRSPTRATSPTVGPIPFSEANHDMSSRKIPKNPGHSLVNVKLEDEDEANTLEKVSIRRRGKLRYKKRKCRRGSIYGQQTEVREPPEPSETQISQIDKESQRQSPSSHLEESKHAAPDNNVLPIIKQNIPSSFLPPQILKELSRELNQELVEWEFNSKMRFALEEVLRVMGDFHHIIQDPRQNIVQRRTQDVPRLFYRQSARFELLNSQSLIGLKPLDYLGRYVYVNDTRKMMFGRAFNKYREEFTTGPRYLLRKYVFEALHEIIGRALDDDEIVFLEQSLEMGEKLDFRTWCGVCAFVERTLPKLLSREEDPPLWLERVDFEVLDRRLSRIQPHEGLASMLQLIRDR